MLCNMLSMNTINLTNKIFLTFIISAFVIAISLFTYTYSFAASSAVVSATVTVQNISMTVASSTIAWGTLPAGTASSTNPAFTNTLTNSGNVAENFLVKGQNSANWTLAATAGSDAYEEATCATSCTTAPTGYTALTTTNATLASNVASLATSPLDLYIKVPTTSTVFTQQSVDITLTAVAF